MTADEGRTTVISVRAEAQRSVDPDAATLVVRLKGSGTSKVAARDDADAALRRVTDALGVLGAVVSTVEAQRGPIVWRVRSRYSHERIDYKNGREVRTGRHDAGIGLALVVRDFTLLPAAEQAVADVDAADLENLSWHVDDDNAAWALVRADAIRAALLKGQDYAAAIGGAVVAIEQVSDAGLLGDHGYDGEVGFVPASATFRMASDTGPEETIGLDPVPQQLAATIDARLLATAGRLPERDPR